MPIVVSEAHFRTPHIRCLSDLTFFFVSVLNACNCRRAGGCKTTSGECFGELVVAYSKTCIRTSESNYLLFGVHDSRVGSDRSSHYIVGV